jgi:hypothetical protein
MGNDGGWIGWAAAIGVLVWVAFFGGAATIQGWFGGDSYDSRLAALEGHMRQGRIGSSADVWLVKGNFGVPDRVALFYGYMDDFAACWEFKTAHAAQFPADTYTCEYAN